MTIRGMWFLFSYQNYAIIVPWYRLQNLLSVWGQEFFFLSNVCSYPVRLNDMGNRRTLLEDECLLPTIE